ncbi:hypothetical protein F4777DRAFT_51890 [Nemania sp. FL0916]|nr:hypothetical protein F4777DRAFT_51890 [Nemania sp. FL0916]
MTPTGGAGAGGGGGNSSGSGSGGGAGARTGAGTGTGTGTGASSSSVPALDVRQVAASNSTLNAWVGRRQQPAWLTNGTPVQPSPRPPRPPRSSIPDPNPNPNPIPMPTPITTPTALAAATPAGETAPSAQPQFQPQPQPASASASASASAMSAASGCETRAQPRLLPPQPHSQSDLPPRSRPSEPQSRESQPSGPSPGPGAPVSSSTLGQPPHAHARAVFAPRRLSASLADPVLPSPAPSDEPSPCVSLPRDSPNIGNPGSVRSHSDSTITEARFVLDDHVNPPLISPQSRDPASPANCAQGASPREILQVQSPPVMASTGEMAYYPPPPPTSTDPDISDSSRRDASGSAPKRRRIENKSLALLNSVNVKPRLTTYLRAVGGDLGLEESVERPRFHLLLRACHEGDLFFVAFHHLFCSWTLNPASVHGLCQENVHNTSLIDNALGIMGTLLRPNSKLRMKLLQWFADFPTPLSVLQNDQHYAQTLRLVLDFLICVSKRWTVVNQEHLALAYPLLMTEMVNTFHLYSPILQSIVFRASRRTIGIPDMAIGTRFDEMFKHDQEKHLDTNEGTYSLRMAGDAYDRYNDEMAHKYQMMVAQFRSTAWRVPNNGGPTPSANPAARFPGAPSPTTGDFMAGRNDVAYGYAPAYPPVRPERVLSGNQNVNLPSPTYSPTPLMHPMAVAAQNPMFASQFAAVTPPYALPNSPTFGFGGGMASPHQTPHQSPFQSPNINQQEQNGPLHPYPSNGTHLQQQQQQQQPQHVFGQASWPQQQQFQFAHRRRSQPGAAPSPRHSPILPTPPQPGQASLNGQQAPQIYNSSGVPVPSTAIRDPTSFTPPQNMVHSSRAILPSTIRPRQPSSPRQPVHPNRLIPPPGARISQQHYPSSPYERRSVNSSLHQAHLRSPKRVLKTSSASTPERYYQAVKYFALGPIRLSPQPYLHELEFDLGDDVVQRLAPDERVAGEPLLVNRFSNGSMRIRLRCCCRPGSTVSSEPVPEDAWVTWPTAWPDHIFMSLNNQIVEIKRKQHHFKDLPVEISSFVRAGKNFLHVSVPVPNTHYKLYTIYLAIEVVETLSHSAVVQMVRASGSQPASETRELVRKRLAGSASNPADDDSDLEIPNDGISIDLADPFTATIFKVPVRGKACTHIECFDLENWLNTRLGKKTQCQCGNSPCVCPKEPSFVDRWRCPRCDGDARPYSLRIDEFLVEVRGRLEQNNQLRTKSITVSADGTWKANEPLCDDDSDDNSDDNSTRATSKSAPKPSVQRTVIELDDD